MRTRLTSLRDRHPQLMDRFGQLTKQQKIEFFQKSFDLTGEELEKAVISTTREFSQTEKVVEWGEVITPWATGSSRASMRTKSI